MGFKLNGYVLRPARVASGNDPDTNEAVSGVDRDHILANDRTSPLDGEQTLESLGYQVRPDGAGVLVEPYADMYRAAVLEKAEIKDGSEQYCLFAATTGSLSTIEDVEMAIIGGRDTADPIAGTLPVGGIYTDGTLSFYVRDGGQRDIADVISITVIKAPEVPTGPYETFTFDTFTEEDVSTGKVTLGGSASTDLNGGFSVERGDVVLATAYVLASPTFWWSRNDPDVTRFGWDGRTSRWLPLKGGRAASLGSVIPEEDFKLVPPPSRFEVGQVLPGVLADPDAYALVRCGLYADADSTPLNILVVADAEAAGGTWNPAWDALPTPTYPFVTANAVVGVTSGVLLLNPSFATDNAGRTLWYNAENFQADADGDLGEMATLPTGSNQGFPSLSPVPGPTDRPFLRIGSRRYLTPIPKDTDGDLSDPLLVPSGSFQWSKATGKIVLSAIDIAKCIPGSSTVDGDAADYALPFLGAHLYYDGVALSTQPVPLKAAVATLNAAGLSLDGSDAAHGVPSNGRVYVPRAVCMPPPGVSGVRWELDGTGETPVVPGPSSLAVNEEPQTRPNGTGLVRRIDGTGAVRIYGDAFFFSKDHAYENTDVVEYDEDLKDFKFRVPKNEVEISRMVAPTQPSAWDNTSRIQFRRRPVKGQGLYFRQAEVILSVYADEARVFSRLTEPYSITGSENIRFAIDGTTYVWNSGTLNTTGVAANYTAQQVVDSLVADAGVDPDAVGVMRGRVFLRASDLTSGTVEIGWNVDPGDGSTDYTDLSGHAALGFLPGWRVDTSGDTFRWLPDNGAYLGLFRSPVNMDRSDDTPDIRAVARISDKVLNSNIPANPFMALSPSPLLDVPGYTDTSHFKVIVGLLTVELENYKTRLDVGVVYDWVNDRFIWSEEGKTGGTQVPYPTSTLQLDNVGVFPETVSPLAMDDGTFGLNLRRARDTVGQTLPASFSVPEDLTGEDLTIDFLMPGAGGPGQAVLVTPEGEEVAAGGKGETTAGLGIFFDSNVADQTDLYDAVEVGYLLHILTGENTGVYTITVKNPLATTTFGVNPPFPATDASTQWRIYEAKTRDAVDMTLLADVQQVTTSHFPDEPFKVRTLTSAGVVNDTTVPNANVADAMASGRLVSFRFGLDPIAANERTVAYLVQGVDLGGITSSGLVCPDLTDPHLTLSGGAAAYFQIRVGAEVFSTTAGTLTLNVGSADPDKIDVDTTTGAVLIGTDVVDGLAGSDVYYDQVFLNQADVPAGTCEINPSNGDVNITEDDNVTYIGQATYFVEQMVAENNLDVTLNPMNGSLLFSKPLRAMQIVEVNYYQADTNGDKKLDDDGNPIEITEFLSLMVTLEEATYVSDTEWTFNPTGRTVSSVVEPFIWVGTNLMNFAGVKNASAIDGVITITDEAQALLETDSTTKVQINYGVLEAFGGESSYTVSTPPVYRKPFWIDAEASTFVLETNRVEDFKPGLLMVLGPTPLYVESALYDAEEDTTTVTIFPTPENEIGSRAPGRDAGLTLSDFVVSVSRGGSPGFMPILDTTTTPLLECDRGQVAVSFYGDVRRYMQTNHLLEINGYPYLIINSDLSEDGYNTVVQVGTPLYEAHDNSDVVRVSVRPLYFAPPPVEFTGLGPFIPTEEYDLFLMGRTDVDGNALPGKVLVEGLNYTVDPATGNVTFQSPGQKALQPGEYLHFRYTRQITVSPTSAGGAILYPVYRGKYLYTTTPTVENRLLGAVLKGEYTYRSQDSFFYTVQTLEEYLGEVSTVSASQGVIPFSGGPTSFNTPAANPAQQGNLGLRGGSMDAQDQDRAARVFVEFFNGVILAFEQVLEAIDGRIIGDRDGKFRFFIGHDKRYPPPGYEDEITGNLNQRLIWREIINTWAPASLENNDGYFRTKDTIYLPTTAEVPQPTARPGETSGPAMDPALLTFFMDRQRRFIKNDMDDRILKGPRRPTIVWSTQFMFPVISFKGNFDDMWEDHKFSRLYPTETEHFSQLYPGINYDPTIQYPGFFTPGRDIEMPGPEPGETSEQTVKTTGEPNGSIANNALGDIPNIIDVSVIDRLGRGRVWAYYPSGSRDLDDALGITTTGKATLVVTVLTLSEFPTTEEGWPDIDPATGLITGAGDGVVSSLLSGNPDMSTPPFKAGDRVNYGKPNGTTYTLKDSDGNGIYIDEVLAGCVVTLAKSDGDAAPAFTSVSGNSIYIDNGGTTRLAEVISGDEGYGDTLYVGPGSGVSYDSDDMPATLDETAALAASLPEYRTGFDISMQRKSGQLIDITFPGPDDNFFLNLQALFGQNPPDPLSCVEGVVKFINTESEPLKLPCLLGEDKDDSGDQQIPFMKGYPNELVVLGLVAPLLEDLYVDTGYAGLPYAPAYYNTVFGGPPASVEMQVFKAVFPDECVIGDGNLVEGASLGPTAGGFYPLNPAALYTGSPLDKATEDGLAALSGLGDLRRFDLLLSQAPQAALSTGLWPGATGILEVADVVYEVPVSGPDPSNKGTIEVPRFVSPCLEGAVTALGRSHRYTLRGFAAFVEEVEGGGGGVTVDTHTVLAPTVFRNIIDFSTVPDMSGLTGLDGLINIGGAPGVDFNALVIRIYDPDPAAATAFLGAITIISGVGMTVRHYFYNAITGVTTAPYVGAQPVFDADSITITYDNSAPGAADPLEVALNLTPGARYDFRLDIDTYGDSETGDVSSTAVVVGKCHGSETCAVGRDRLTFTEHLDLTLAKPRDYNPANGEVIELGAALNVWDFVADGVAGYTVNDCTEINGGEYLTFLNRYDTTPVFYVGTWDGTRGALRAMSWEGHANTPLARTTYPDITGITAAGMPSSDLQADAGEVGDFIIYAGSFKFWDGDSDTAAVATGVGAYTLEGNRNYLLHATTGVGGLANVVHNDILVVNGNSAESNSGATKTGTYLVRHAVPQGTEVSGLGSQMPSETLLSARQQHTLSAPFPAAQAAGPSGDTSNDSASTLFPPPGTTGAELVPDDGFLDLAFPVVTDAVDSTAPGEGTITVSGVAPVMRDPTDPSVNHGWENSGRLYLILKDQYATYSDDAGGPGLPGWVVDKNSVWSVAYTGLTYDPEEGTIVFTVTSLGASAQNAYNDSTLGYPAFMAAARSGGVKVSGMTYFGIRQMGSHLPPNNLVGADVRNPITPLMAGFEHLTFGNRNANMLNPYLDTAGGGPGYADDVWQSYDAPGDIVHDLVGTSPPVSGEIVVGVPLPVDNTTFVEDKYTPLYGRMYDPTGTKADPVVGVATYLHLNDWSNTHWDPVHFGTTISVYKDSGPGVLVNPLLRCLLPSDRWVAAGYVGLGPSITPDGSGAYGDPGFWAYSGVFLEPSFRRPVQNLNTVWPKVVSASSALLTVDGIGARDFESFGGATKYEEVYASVRRVRRWHEAQVDIIDLLEPLKYVYQIRRGVVDTYTESTRELVALTTLLPFTEATNLGPFNDPDVNINAGDVLRVLNTAGDLVDTAEIQRVEGSKTLKLRRPGLTTPAVVAAPGDFTFEVYLEQAIVPHEQSNEQLLDMVTQKVVFKRAVTYDTPGGIGGFVGTTNELKDSDPSVTSWAAEGVEEGDYLIIDPAGVLYKANEYGQRPSGDMSVIDRDPGPYIPGGPAKLDDNRGFYQITAVDEDSGGESLGTLMVSGESRFTDGEVFGDGSQDAGYVVMPTVHGSWLTTPTTVDGTGVEEQQDLRPTAGPVGDSYYDRPSVAVGADGYKSIDPFGYRIIRPNTIFSQDTVELILFIRERILSWIDEINVLYPKSGDYWVFQRDDHIEDVGSATDTSAGLGIMSNLVIDSLKGLTDVTPFANMSDCLSVLDRRFWCLDYRLDMLPTSASPTYTQFTTGDFSQRPVEPDLIDAVLNTDDLFRDQRYGWITFRANTNDGSIRNATREKRSLARRLRKQREALMRQKGLDKA